MPKRLSCALIVRPGSPKTQSETRAQRLRGTRTVRGAARADRDALAATNPDRAQKTGQLTNPADNCHMKKVFAPLALAAALATTSTGCYGSYTAFNKVHKWNGTVTDSTVVKSALHLGLWIVPVYPLLLTVDWLVLNNVEAITGSNPLK